jgi:SAM-dependent methyltransferase
MSGQATVGERAGAHLERFDVDDQGGRLIDAEHRGRYWWAAQIAAGRDVLDAACGTGYGSKILLDAGATSVTGVDVSADAVAATAARLGEGANVVAADIRELPFDDDSFDLVVSWETIEHVEEGERVLAEFRRVLRPQGILLVSSPNPEVYPQGNEHHVHEYRPQELAELASAHFANVVVYRQHAWLASVIDRPGGLVDDLAREGGQAGTETRAVHDLAEGMQTYSLIAAGDAELPAMRELTTLGDAFEVRWWEEQLIDTRRLLAITEARQAETAEMLGEASGALLEANQRLAQIPVLEHQLEEARATLLQTVRDVEGSVSWRLTAPLRRLQALRRRLR